MIWKEILLITILVVISLLIFYAIKAYVLPRVKIKKLYVFILMIVFIVLPAFLGKYYKYPAVQYTVMLAVSVTMLVYIELARMERERKNKPVVGRPKPKKIRMQNDSNKK